VFRNIEEDLNDVWMWDYFKNRGYLTFTSRDICSSLARFVYGKYISEPWTDAQWKSLLCDLRKQYSEMDKTRFVPQIKLQNLRIRSKIVKFIYFLPSLSLIFIFCCAFLCARTDALDPIEFINFRSIPQLTSRMRILSIRCLFTWI
jgi:hypothetical protein